MGKKRGQVSIEFLTIFAFIFLMMIPLILIFQSESQESRDSLYITQVRNIGIRLVDKAESIYYLGEPSKTTVKVSLPQNVYDATISGRELVFFYRSFSGTEFEIPITSQVDIYGNISTERGVHFFTLESTETGVRFSG